MGFVVLTFRDSVGKKESAKGDANGVRNTDHDGAVKEGLRHRSKKMYRSCCLAMVF